MFSAIPAGISPNGNFTIFSIAPGCSNAANARLDAVFHAPCGSEPTLSPPMSCPNTSSGTEPCSAEIANIVAPPTMWLMRSFTVHSVHNVGLPSCAALVCSSTPLVVSTTRCSIATPSITAPSSGDFAGDFSSGSCLVRYGLSTRITHGRIVTYWCMGPVLTASKALPGTDFSWFKSLSFQRGSAAPVMYHDDPLSATIIPYFFRAFRITSD